MNNSKIEISVVIPTYNRSTYVVDAINSVLNQTYYQYIMEIIVIDDGGTDDTEEVLSQTFCDKKIKYYRKMNGGVSTARNYGIKVAKGNWIAFLDSDDEWKPEKIQQQIKTIKDHPEIDAIGTGYRKGKLHVGLRAIDNLYKIKYKDIFLTFFPTTSTVIVKKTVLDKIGGFNESQKYCEDNALFLEIAYSYNFYYLPDALIKFGHDKLECGDSGLSANMKEMQQGAMNNLKKQYHLRRINGIEYGFYYVYHSLKYLRRIILVKMRKRK